MNLQKKKQMYQLLQVSEENQRIAIIENECTQCINQNSQMRSVQKIFLIIFCMIVISACINLLQYLQRINQPIVQKSQALKKEQLQVSLALRNIEIAKLQNNRAIKTKFNQIQIQNYSNKSIKNKTKFDIPKIVWLYQKETQKNQFLSQKRIQNINIYSQKSGFEVRLVTRNNYHQWLSKNETKYLQSSIQEIKKIQFNLLVKNFENIDQTIIILQLLKTFGGVFIKQPYIFIQQLNWLENIEDSIVLNTGRSYSTPQIFGFFALSHGSKIQRQNIKMKILTQNYLIKYPGLMNIFLAAYPRTQFLTALCQQLKQIIFNFQSIQKIIEQNQMITGSLDLHDMNSAFTLASLSILAKKQKQLDKNKFAYEQRFLIYPYAIDYYGLLTINSYYYPDKIQFYFNNRLKYYNNFFNYLAKMSQNQCEQSIGPLRYIANPDPFGQFQSRIKQSMISNTYTIVENSFFHRQIFMGEKLSFIQQDKQNHVVALEYKQWNELPKILWLFWSNGFQNSTAIHQLCILNLQNNAEKAGFKVNMVSETNINQFLPHDEVQKIQNTFNHAKIQKNAQTKADIIRLALISNLGGIYLDSSFFFLEDFNWITKIADENHYLFFNRFGQIPNVLMQFHPIEGGLFNWTIDQIANTKVQWHLAYQNNFIAANKDNEFVKDWYNLFIYFLTSTYQQTQIKMRQCNIYDFKWTWQKNRYLTAMDSLKSVLGCKQNEIDRNREQYGDFIHVNDYYKLWAFNGFNGIQKFRFYNNYANSYQSITNGLNILLYRVSQKYVEQVYGKIFKCIKFYGDNVIELNNFLATNIKNHFVCQVHPQSIFAKYLFDSKNRELFIDHRDQVHARIKQ